MELIKLFKAFRRLFHIHRWKPIVSMYVSFNTRNVIWECEKCKQRKAEKEYRYVMSFSKPTDCGIEHKSFNAILKGDKLGNHYPFNARNANHV